MLCMLSLFLEILRILCVAEVVVPPIPSGKVYAWKEKSKYYYLNLRQKLVEIVTPSPYSLVEIIEDANTSLPAVSNLVYASSFPPSPGLLMWWKSIPKPKQMRVDPFLCDAVYLKKNPIFNNQGCQLPHYMNPSAPRYVLSISSFMMHTLPSQGRCRRCQTKYLKWVCDNARIAIDNSTSNNFVLPEADHSTTELPPIPWLARVTESYVSMCGQIVGKFGLIHTTANCMSTGYKTIAATFQKQCAMSMVDMKNSSRIAGEVFRCGSKTPFSDEVVYVDKVFVVAEVDDTYVYHIHLEIVPRIVYHLKWLQQNPDVKILYGCDAKNNAKITEHGLKQGLQGLRPFMEFLGLSMKRLIVHKHVFAREVYLPMEGGCQDPVYNTWQVLTMRDLFLRAVNRGLSVASMKEATISSQSITLRNAPSKSGTAGTKPVMMLMKRSSNAKHTRNGHDSVRQWSDVFADQIVVALSDRFPSYRVVLYSDRNETLMSCHSCQILEFSQTDVLVGVHGAGLSNMIYMKPNSAVVELGPYGNDARCLLGGGPFSRTAALLSHNYMIHHPPYEEFKWVVESRVSEFNVSRFVMHIHAFLKSINKLEG